LENKNNSVSEFDRAAVAIEKLTTSDWNRIHKAAQSFLYGTVFSDVDELENETLLRVFDGKRKWPEDVPFVTFIINAMKSIADGERSLNYKTKEVLASDLTQIRTQTQWICSVTMPSPLKGLSQKK
jgi:hypothetical protein